VSKLVLVNYRVSDAERRAVLQKIAQIRAMLKRCAALRAELAKLEPVAGEDWAKTLARYVEFETGNITEFTAEHNRLDDALPGIVERLENALAEARAKRTRLELTAATLAAIGATAEEQAILGGLDRRAATLYGDKYEKAVAQVEAILRKRFETPLTEVGEKAPSAGQLALAKELLVAAGTAEPVAVPAAPQQSPQRPTDASRINKLAAQIGGLDPSLASFDDLLERLRQLPAADPAQRSLLIDSIELSASERLAAARRKRETAELVDEGLAWLAPFASLSADEFRRKLEQAGSAGDLNAARAAHDEAKKWAMEEARREDGARIRAALISELQDLGYEVNVQAQAWTEGSRITASRPNDPNYDVQLSAVPGGQVQSKVRAYDHAGRSTGLNRRDVEVEQSWCDDLAKLNKQLAERGIGAEILREDGPGTAAQIPLPSRAERDLDAPDRLTQLERE
jgi:hypothetical protein